MDTHLHQCQWYIKVADLYVFGVWVGMKTKTKQKLISQNIEKINETIESSAATKRFNEL